MCTLEFEKQYICFLEEKISFQFCTIKIQLQVYFICDMKIDEIINSDFQQNILELQLLPFSDAFFKSTTRASPFSCVFHQ